MHMTVGVHISQVSLVPRCLVRPQYCTEGLGMRLGMLFLKEIWFVCVQV